jgi:hypothetical protein
MHILTRSFVFFLRGKCVKQLMLFFSFTPRKQTKLLRQIWTLYLFKDPKPINDVKVSKLIKM